MNVFSILRFLKPILILQERRNLKPKNLKMKTQSKNYDLRQLMLSFAYLAYTGEEITTPNPEGTILDSINAALPQIQLSSGKTLEDWEVVWGPAVYTVPGAKYQENMMYVVNKKGTSDYVIASRGTNFVSQVDWFLDDFELLYTMPWPIPGAHSSAPKDAAISESTSIDLNIHILDKLMSDHDGIGLLQFLHNITMSDKINVCVTGHSLGAAVANVLSLYLLENPDLWDATMESTVSCISFAAPTIGNGSFAKNALSVFEQAANANGSFPGWDCSMGTNLDNVGCNLDTVPLFSTASNIFEHDKAGPLFSIYASPNNASNNIEFSNDNMSLIGYQEWKYFQSLVLQKVAAGLGPQDYTQLQTQSMIPGKFIGSTLNIYDTGFTTFMEAFAMQAAWQHSNSYPIYLNLTNLLDPNIVNKGSASLPKLPVISKITPDSNHNSYLSDNVSVTITGENFSTSMFGNFIVFKDSSMEFPYEIKSVSETEIKAVFQLKGIAKGEYPFFIVKTSAHYKSNTVSFKVERWFSDI